MSRDAGGLAQMTYQNPLNSGIGAPAAGFASRGKGAQLKRLNLASPPKVAPISENQETVTTPRTSRAHMLAGLRTAPRTPTAANAPASAPYNQSRFNGTQLPRYADNKTGVQGQALPQTAIGASFPSSAYGQMGSQGQQQQQGFSFPEPVLAPPSLNLSGQEDEGMDPSVLAQLMATEMFLEQRRKQLQQQLLQLTAQGMHINAGLAGGNGQGYPSTPMTAIYHQQGLSGMSVPQELPGQPGVYLVYNSQTGQYQYVMDTSATQQQDTLSGSPPAPVSAQKPLPPKMDGGRYRNGVSSPSENVANPFERRSISPPKKTPSPPVDAAPLPPPSANAFRRGHKKVPSLAFASNINSSDAVADGPKSAFTRSVGFPQTPMTGTFGPGQGRAGEHPSRQPRGPPPLEELQAAPTTKHEGSKNFATRQRRRAVTSLVRAGIERRGVRAGSGGSLSPASETELTFSLSDNDSDSVHSAGGRLSGRPSYSSMRGSATSAIGSERKERGNSGNVNNNNNYNGNNARRQNSAERGWSINSVSSDEGVSVGGKLVEVRAPLTEEQAPATEERKRTPMMVLSSAEKRKNTVF